MTVSTVTSIRRGASLESIPWVAITYTLQAPFSFSTCTTSSTPCVLAGHCIRGTTAWVAATVSDQVLDSLGILADFAALFCSTVCTGGTGTWNY